MCLKIFRYVKTVGICFHQPPATTASVHANKFWELHNGRRNRGGRETSLHFLRLNCSSKAALNRTCNIETRYRLFVTYLPRMAYKISNGFAAIEQRRFKLLREAAEKNLNRCLPTILLKKLPIISGYLS